MLACAACLLVSVCVCVCLYVRVQVCECALVHVCVGGEGGTACWTHVRHGGLEGASTCCQTGWLRHRWPCIQCLRGGRPILRTSRFSSSSCCLSAVEARQVVRVCQGWPCILVFEAAKAWIHLLASASASALLLTQPIAARGKAGATRRSLQTAH